MDCRAPGRPSSPTPRAEPLARVYRLYSSTHPPPPDLMWALMWTRDIINPRDEDW